MKIIKSDLTVDDILEKEKNSYSDSGSMEYSNDISAVLTVMPITQYQMLKQEVLSEYPLFGLMGIVDRRVLDENYNEVEIYINTDKGVLKVLYDCSKLKYSVEMDSRSFADVNDYVRRNSGVM